MTSFITQLYTVAFIVTACIALIRYLIHRLSNTKQPYLAKIMHSDNILSGSFLKESDTGHQLTPLEARALSNLQLAATFGIRNSFTTTEENTHREFRKRAAQRLNLTESEWKAIACKAQLVISSYLQISLQQTNSLHLKVSLPSMVRVVVLKVVLSTMFDEYQTHSLPPDQEYHVLDQVSDMINKLWILSKQGSTNSESLLNQLNAHLNCLLPEAYSYPLNFILPSFETMWRVTLRGVMELRFRDCETWNSHYQRMFKDILNNPTLQTMKKFDNEYGASVENIVDEMLRLYPPTRRIHRAISASDGRSPIIASVDIESLHRDPEIWGKDSLCFRPTRWRSGLSETQHAAFFPFGKKMFVCPAKPSFAPRMLAILVGAISIGIEQATLEWNKETNSFIEKQPISNRREDLNTLNISYHKSNFPTLADTSKLQLDNHISG
ncbi:7603_t:CDS:1 [Ambispora leptoticha]|uniref:7603_t:CDS:1 n=1 Tax=Ambispora leptoticha TaxID=144679 RepID=A0A9N9GP87_9GLOM|nr:7603_t:CDS:1 [Ambispora leptoticha]